MRVNLIVIKTNKLEEQIELYSLLGLNFEYHQHGNGPFHYSTVSNDLVFEIYPLLYTQESADNTTRLGFEIEKLDEKLRELSSKNIVVISNPKHTKYGRIALISDHDGRKIELKEKF